MLSRRLCPAHLAGALLVLAAPAQAGHPFITDDTGTQGTGKFELQLGSQYTRTDMGGATFANFQFAPQLSYGLAEPVDLIARPTYNINIASGGAASRNSGWGDTNLEAKWRFWQQDAWSLGVRAGTGFPSGNFARGLDSGQSTPRAYLLGGYRSRPLESWMNVGWIRNVDDPAARPWLAHVSGDMLWKVAQTFQIGIDVAADQNPLRAANQWPAVALVGAIWTVHRGWDLDAGFQRGLDHSAARNQVLLGATVRW